MSKKYFHQLLRFGNQVIAYVVTTAAILVISTIVTAYASLVYLWVRQVWMTFLFSS
jgi:hypothetical protein